MRVLVCGSRNWRGMEAIRRELQCLVNAHRTVVVIHGTARGADMLTDLVAQRLFLRVRPFPPDWERYGKGAGVIRNRQMLEEGKPDLVLAFTKDLQSSRGTLNMVNQARAAGVPVRVFDR